MEGKASNRVSCYCSFWASISLRVPCYHKHSIMWTVHRRSWAGTSPFTPLDFLPLDFAKPSNVLPPMGSALSVPLGSLGCCPRPPLPWGRKA